MNRQDFGAFRALLEQHPAEYIDLKLVDLSGALRHVTLPVASFTESVLESGVGFDGSSYGFRKTHASDMVMIPDLATGHPDPFRDVPTLSYMASAHLAEDGLPLCDQDSRATLKRALARLAALGIADEALIAPEYEFYVFDSVQIKSTVSECGFAIESKEVVGRNAYHLEHPDDRYGGFRDRATRILTQLGMNVRYHHHEAGRHGQQEIEMALEPALVAADHAVLVRYVLRNLAAREHLCVTHMPKPLYDNAGSGWHTHQMLRKGGMNVFHDPQGLCGLSRTALAYAGGLLEHGRALSAWTNASTNSYRRLTPGFEAPVSRTFGPADRTAAVRIPKWAVGVDTRIEYRSSDFTGNAYLMLAAMLMAGMAGVEAGVDPVAAGYGPAEKLDPARVKTLPHSLDAALDALAEDKEFLLRDGVFTPAIVERWIDMKRKECAEVSKRPHPHEFRLYFDC